MKKIIIVDWANNHVFKNKVFSSEEDAMDFIYENAPDEAEDLFAVCAEEYTPTPLDIFDMLEGRNYNAQLSI